MAINTLRMTGLSSGIDTESIVSAMTQRYKAKVDYEKQNKQLLELKQEAWKEMNTKIYSFYTKTLNDFKFRTTYGKTSISNSNSDVISIAKDANLPAGTHTIDVQQVAKSAMVSSRSIKDSQDKQATPATTLADLGIKNGDTLSIQVKGKTATVTVADITVETVDEDGNPVTTSRAMTIEDLQKQMKIEMAADEIFESINFNFDTNVGAFIINSKKTGVDESISLIATNVDPSDPDNENPWEILGIQSVDGIMEYSGQNAIYTYNGGVALESTTNTVNINGLKATIIGESKGVPVTIAAVKDTEATLEVARNFVDEYNKLIEEINTLVDAPSARNYRPLTDEQKESMSESDIKLWNERVQSGILRKDSVLSSIVNDMREIVGKSDLFKLGIGTGKDWTEKGKLYIDEAKLSKIIEEDPEMFDSILKDVGTKLYDNISTKLRGTKDKSSNFLFADKVLTKQITDSTDKISTLEDRLVKQEDLYYAKFTAMEKMLSQLNSQSSWLSSQF